MNKLKTIFIKKLRLNCDISQIDENKNLYNYYCVDSIELISLLIQINKEFNSNLTQHDITKNDTLYTIYQKLIKKI